MFVCGICQESVDTTDPDAVYAVKLKEALRFLGTELVEGRGVYFHEECFPWDDPSYREKPRPAVLHQTD
jgi:hypothetical protein